MQRTSVVHSPVAHFRALIQLMRPKQWIKNGFVLAPLLFTGGFMKQEAAVSAFFATLLFCVASSAVYVVNDLRDIDSDRRHPIKRVSRPLAAGTLPASYAYGLLTLLYCILALGWFVAPNVLYAIAAYLLLNLAYSLVLKHQPVVDIFSIAIGFVLRVYAGALAMDVPVSDWMFVTTLCLALYLAAVKRRQELRQSGSDGRDVLNHYSVALIDRYAEMSATGALVFYCMFVMSIKPELIVTVPLVLFGFFRYWYVAEKIDVGESPADVLLADWPLLVTVILWIGVCAWAVLTVASTGA